ncbi:hypothetical protein EYF80_001802 [Liparis tanakae]|uniref:Uncharacterized protein n=1 Tax=Liparis tanakae TaxID=230148 RepID=A0A4Z2JDV5_9TELE|nr:hypothetical protein EYF80_001802 [Liparis tanakae]
MKASEKLDECRTPERPCSGDFLFAPLRDAYRQNDMSRLNEARCGCRDTLPAAGIDQLSSPAADSSGAQSHLNSFVGGSLHDAPLAHLSIQCPSSMLRRAFYLDT